MKAAPNVSGKDSIYVISVAADLAGMHPQTLRQYDRLGLVSPKRTKGKGRRYSDADIARLRQIQTLSKEGGVNLAGIQQIMQMEDELEKLRAQVLELALQLKNPSSPIHRIFTADSSGRINTRSPQVMRASADESGGYSTSRQLALREEWRDKLPQDLRRLFLLALRSSRESAGGGDQ